MVTDKTGFRRDFRNLGRKKKPWPNYNKAPDEQKTNHVQAMPSFMEDLVYALYAIIFSDGLYEGKQGRQCLDMHPLEPHYIYSITYVINYQLIERYN
jgi:hypothetical protein